MISIAPIIAALCGNKDLGERTIAPIISFSRNKKTSLYGVLEWARLEREKILNPGYTYTPARVNDDIKMGMIAALKMCEMYVLEIIERQKEKDISKDFSFKIKEAKIEVNGDRVSIPFIQRIPHKHIIHNISTALNASCLLGDML